MNEPFLTQAAVARDRYVSVFHQAIREFEASTNFAVELLVRPNGRETPSPFCLSRVDLIFGDAIAPEIRKVADAVVPGSSMSFSLSTGLEIHQDDFSWEALRVTFSAEGFEIEALSGWLDTWLDPSEIRKPDSHGLSGVVHDLAWSQHGRNAWRIDLDLGSAPIVALEELLSRIVAAGVTSLELSRNDLTDV